MATKTVEMHLMALELFEGVRDRGFPTFGKEVDTLADLRVELFRALSEEWEDR